MRKWWIAIWLVFLASLIWIPLWMLLSGSLMSQSELAEKLAALNSGQGYATWSVMPEYPTLRSYVKLLLDSPEFFVMFWNSCKQVGLILLGQLLVAAPAAWAFARYRFRGRKLLFTMYIVLMLMPFQVTMVSSYLVLKRFELLNTIWAVVLPGVFSTFPVFLMQRFFNGIPQTLIEAAELDGANAWAVFRYIGLPLGAPGILSSIVLNFLEYWSAIEQPLTFLDSPSLWPVSLYMPNLSFEKAGVSLAASVIMLMPALLIFLFGQRYLEQGIRASGLKD